MAISSGPVVEIGVTFNPPNEIICERDPAQVHWGKNQTVRWTLKSSDRGAVLRSIDIHPHPEGPPFTSLGQNPNDPRVFESGKCNEVQATYKYDIVVYDGNNKESRLDPELVLGNPPK